MPDYFFVGYSVVEFITSKRFSWHLNLPGPFKMVENFSLGFNSFLGLVGWLVVLGLTAL